MPFTLTMPKLSPTMEEGTIAEWHKKEGDRIEAGDVLFEVSTDKATVEYNALDEGWLRKILISNGKEAKVNQPVAIFTEKQDESIEGYQPEGIISTEAAAPQAQKSEPSAAPIAATPTPPPPPPALAPQARILASPLARKLAKDKGLDLTGLKGTGPGGRIMSRDLVQASQRTAIGRKEMPSVPAGSYEEETLTPMRKTISKRLQEAKSTIPHFYVTMVIDPQGLMDLREQLKKFGVKITYNDMIIRGCALALRSHPKVNSGFNAANNTIIRYKTVDISVAVNLANGLITPIVRHADYKSLTEISQEVKELAGRAKDGKLQEHEYKGGSFTISNTGMYGISDFVAIINPPQAGILAVSGIQEVPVVRNGQVVPGRQMSLTLSGDHRVIDGVSGAEFLKTLQKYLENPSSLLI